MDMGLFRAFVLRAMGESLDSLPVAWLDGWETVEALWPINERFRPNIHQIRSLPYDKTKEAAADRAIEALVMDWPGADWANLEGSVWRVLLERQQQGIIVALANEAEGKRLMPVPSGLPVSARTGAAMIFLLHQMKLPFPASDRSGFELPVGALPASLRRH
jgi:hypothetical protein